MKTNCFLCLLLFSIFFSCNEKLNYTEKIDFVVIRTYDSKYGSYEIKLQDKKMVDDIWNKTKLLKNGTSEQLKPFISSIDIDFGQNIINENPSYNYLNKYSTSIIVKENNKYIIRKADGNFIDDEYAKYIIDLLNKPPKDAQVYH